MNYFDLQRAWHTKSHVLAKLMEKGSSAIRVPTIIIYSTVTVVYTIEFSKCFKSIT